MRIFLQFICLGYMYMFIYIDIDLYVELHKECKLKKIHIVVQNVLFFVSFRFVFLCAYFLYIYIFIYMYAYI